ncbi:MAG: NADH:flavin oxidoreductase/NADH oxidase [Lentisphaerae bacterium]|nr:NADH:flavin oxidoreductase/NADH oxidase [Lentisphaerota bacterium]
MLFQPLSMRGVALRNRIVVSPMCQYSSADGFASDWHLVHLGSRAVGGAGLVFTEATAVEARGRISPQDLGIWQDAHIDMLRRITTFIHEQGSVAGIQLAHAGRKASTARPWDGNAALTPDQGGWRPLLAPSAIPFDASAPIPEAMTADQIREVTDAFVQAARRALDAGFKVAEIHAAHGYLLHEFLSPLSNTRTDLYGGSFENRTRLVRDVVAAVRQVWPESLPLFVRISATDWVAGDAWDLEQSIQLARLLKADGVDLIDCSSGGTSPTAKVPVGPGYQTAFAERIRRETGILTGAVGMITSPEQAETILATGQADVVSMAREFLRDPYWPLHAAPRLHTKPAPPPPYGRAF